MTEFDQLLADLIKEGLTKAEERALHRAFYGEYYGPAFPEWQGQLHGVEQIIGGVEQIIEDGE